MRTIAITLVGLACLLLMGVTNRKVEKRIKYNCAPAFSRIKVISDSFRLLSDHKKMSGSGTIGVRSILNEFRKNKKPEMKILGYSKEGRAIESWYFPGTSELKALVIGGVHGSELSSIEVSNVIIDKLKKDGEQYYNVLIIPSLFPDNAAKARLNPSNIGSTKNIGRYSHQFSADPNRQMPSLGKGLNENKLLDSHGRMIEYENQILLQVIEAYKPNRIANLHAIRDETKAGIFADPRTDAEGLAIGFESDSLLVVTMAQHVKREGGKVPGNQLEFAPTALYHKDPPVAPTGIIQKRNFSGSKLPSRKGSGVSLGSWASTAVNDPASPWNNRDAMRIITVEFPGSKRPQDYSSSDGSNRCRQQIESYAAAIQHIFLADYFTEQSVRRDLYAYSDH